MDTAYAGPTITRAAWLSGEKSDIDLVEDQINGWLFAPAHRIAEFPNAGPAMLSIVTPYFEAITCYVRGEASRRKTSTPFLMEGLLSAFPELSDDDAKRYADEVRHGLMHEAAFRNVYLHKGASSHAITSNAGVLWIDPWHILNRAQAHFDSYVGRLRAGEALALLPFERFMAHRKRRPMHQ